MQPPTAVWRAPHPFYFPFARWRLKSVWGTFLRVRHLSLIGFASRLPQNNMPSAICNGDEFPEPWKTNKGNAICHPHCDEFPDVLGLLRGISVLRISTPNERYRGSLPHAGLCVLVHADGHRPPERHGACMASLPGRPLGCVGVSLSTPQNGCFFFPPGFLFK